jgi:hypothetical protein
LPHGASIRPSGGRIDPIRLFRGLRIRLRLIAAWFSTMMVLFRRLVCGRLGRFRLLELEPSQRTKLLGNYSGWVRNDGLID